MLQPVHLAFHSKSPASHLLLGGPKGNRPAGLGEGSAILFWRFKAVRAAASASIMPVEGWPSKKVRITDTDADNMMDVKWTGKVQGDGEEAHADPKGKGKAHVDAMKVNEVIVIYEAEGKTKEWDRLA